ncbi:MAG: helix-turn-helix transcriptional regulator [Dehalococcoidales bacterium]|nr:helix-turn-helix transcriptional regulator [Dehalococcoidales bacterium]
MKLEQYVMELEDDPEFIAEGLSIKIVEEMLEHMKKNNINQSSLAQKLGVSRAHISKIFNAPTNMTLLTITKIAVALGVKPDINLNVEENKRLIAFPISVENDNWSLGEFKKQYIGNIAHSQHYVNSAFSVLPYKNISFPYAASV